MCHSCGTYAHQWEDDSEAFIAAPKRCLGCETLEYGREEIPSDAKGITVNLIPNPYPIDGRVTGDEEDTP